MDFDFSQAVPKPTTLSGCHELIKHLWQHGASQQAELTKLKAQLNTHSTNSSCSPSSDSPRQRAERAKTRADWQQRTVAYWQKRRQGAQLGHQGHGRTLWPVERVHEVIACYPPSACPHCQGTITAIKLRRRKQVFDIVQGQLKVSEYQVYGSRCCQCKTRVRGQLPEAVPAGLLGAHALGIIAALVGNYRLSKREVKMLLDDFFGLVISVGSISNAESLISPALEPAVEEVGQALKGSSYVHADETSHYHQGSQEWLWVATTQELSYFKNFKHRDTASAKDLIGEAYQGIVITDRYGAYNWLPQGQRQYCWAHLIRDFKKLTELGDDTLSYRLLANCQDLFRYWKRIRAGNAQPHQISGLLRTIKRLRAHLREGRLLAGTKTGSLCLKLLKDWDSLWHFLRHKQVEPTNNQAERQLRHGVIWRKKCFGTQSERGQRFVERILTCTLTCRQQARSLRAFVSESLKAHWGQGTYPSLLEKAV